MFNEGVRTVLLNTLHNRQKFLAAKIENKMPIKGTKNGIYCKRSVYICSRRELGVDTLCRHDFEHHTFGGASSIMPA